MSFDLGPVEGLLPALEEPLQLGLRSATVLGLVEGSLEIHDRHAGLRENSRGKRGQQQGGNQGDDVAPEFHADSSPIGATKCRGLLAFPFERVKPVPHFPARFVQVRDFDVQIARSIQAL